MHRRTTHSCQNLLTGLSLRVEPSRRHVLRCTVSTSSSSKLAEPHRPSPELKGDLSRLCKRLVDHAAQPPKGWAHTPSPRGVEKRLTAILKNATPRAPSLEYTVYSAGELALDTEGEMNDESLTLGTFVETRR